MRERGTAIGAAVVMERRKRVPSVVEWESG